jgi:hypothetical protein
MTGPVLSLSLAFAATLLFSSFLCFHISDLNHRLAKERQLNARLGQTLCADGKHTDGPWDQHFAAGAESRQCQICGRTEWQMMTGLRPRQE